MSTPRLRSRHLALRHLRRPLRHRRLRRAASPCSRRSTLPGRSATFTSSTSTTRSSAATTSTLADVDEALARNNLGGHRDHAGDLHARVRQGCVHQPRPGVRRLANELSTRRPKWCATSAPSTSSCGQARTAGTTRSRSTTARSGSTRSTASASWPSQNPDLQFVIEYKPREPRVKMSFDSVARTLLGIEKIGLPNVGILLDFGHSLYGGESPADAAQLAIDYGRLFGMDVNDNLRGWDDDLVAGSVHPIELFEFFYTLRKNEWEGVWQLDQFPFREDSVEAARDGDRVPQGRRSCARHARRRGAAGGAGRPRRDGGPAARAQRAVLVDVGRQETSSRRMRSSAAT